ncbi:B-cell receptor-associated protein 31-like [Biomphalaria glabrata]|uniref:Endoplasmic reticulum transmembrane protein n=1 Tax=Biomphalaria glabrata TaxID=6526 RepID=A0A9W3A4K5_BIOGL|nr:B-cell receptor-associated protein 31-like [Biomphalaria glabrata]
MTLQWTFVATVLYAEIIAIAVLLIPIISPKTWQKVFRSRIASALSAYSFIYFKIFIAVLVMLFLESIREAWKYSSPMEAEQMRKFPEAENVLHMKLFRAQRNMYIAGFALFLWVVLRRLVTLIATEANLMAESEASLKQAQSATQAAKMFMEEKVITDENKLNSATEEKDFSHVEKELNEVKADLERTQEELYKTRLDLSSMKKQAESTNQEYDRLLDEHAKLEKKLAILEGTETEAKKGK